MLLCCIDLSRLRVPSVQQRLPGPVAKPSVSGVAVTAGASLFIISLVSNLLMLAGPLFMLQIYDRVLSSRSIPTLTAFVVIIIAVYAFYAFIETVRSRMSLRL